MSKEKQVSWEINDGVMLITVDNPEMKNGLNWVGIEQLAQCYETMASDKNIRVAVITGNDDYFYTGGRVDASVPGEKERYADAIERLNTLRENNTVPMIAAVSGDCLKAGMGMLESCDFAVAREGVEFGFPEVRMGGVPMMVMMETFGTMPTKRALEAYLTSWNFSAEDAYMMGLVNRVVSKEEFWPTVDKFVHVFLDTPVSLLEMTRRAFKKMGELHTKAERTELAMSMLRSDVLTYMASNKTEYNI